MSSDEPVPGSTQKAPPSPPTDSDPSSVRALGRAEPPVTEADKATVWHLSFANTLAQESAPRRDDWTPEPSSYTLMRMIARGGFGEVWEASQATLRRRIAVKRIRPDLYENEADTEGSFRAHEIAFRQEAMTTAALDHPNIPPVHDLGLDEDGRPLLAMKLVRGQPWDAILTEDFTTLPVPDFLAKHLPILIDVAQAVAFAHSRGIVHRDIKPAQVMVGAFGEVVLMDWGLAVLWDPNQLEAAIPGTPRSIAPSLRRAANPAGTPAFMAPEQTERTAENVGPWTDVFLLGGTLYYVLTGQYPHAGRSSEALMFQAALCEIQSPANRIEGREIPQELSDLAMHALARNPKHRVPSAKDFVAALQDLVSGASKRRESLGVSDAVRERLGALSGDYRECGELLVLLGNARVLWPENPAIPELRRRVLAGYAESALLHGDLLLARVQGERLEGGALRDGLMNRIAKAEEDKRRQADELESANQRLRGHHARAEELLNFMLNDLTEKLQTIGRLDILDTVVDQALGYFNALPVREMTNDMLSRRARGLRLVGETHMERGDVDSAESSFREAFTICEGLVSVFPANQDFALELAECYAAVGRVVRARGDLERAGAAFNQVDSILLPMFRAHPSDLRLKEAVALNSNALADVLAVGGNIEGALERNRRFRELAGELVARDPEKPTLQKHLAEGHGNYGWLLKAQGRAEEALDQYRIALDISQRNYTSNPSNMRSMGDLAFMHNKLGWVLEGMGDLKGAISEFQSSLGIMKQLVRRDPSNMRWRRLLSVSHSRAGRAMEAAGDLIGARHEFEAAVEILEPMAAGDQKDAWNREWLSRALVGLGRVCSTAGDAESARALWARAVGVTKLNVRNYKAAELRHISTHAQALLHLDRLDEARPMVLFLRDKGFRDEDFEAAARAHGFG